MTNIDAVVKAVLDNLTQGASSTLYKGQDMGTRYSLSCNKPASGAAGLTEAVQKALSMDGYTGSRVLIGDNYHSAFNIENNLTDGQICVLAANVVS